MEKMSGNKSSLEIFLKSGIGWGVHSLPDHPEGEIVKYTDCSISLWRTVQTQNKKTERSPTIANHTKRQKHNS